MRGAPLDGDGGNMVKCGDERNRDPQKSDVKTTSKTCKNEHKINAKLDLIFSLGLREL